MNNGTKIGGTVCTVIGSLLFIIGNISGIFFSAIIEAEYGWVGFSVGFVGFVMLLFGISMLIDHSKEKKWLAEINARNAQYGLVKPFYGNRPGQPMYGNQPGQPYQNGYVQPGQFPYNMGNPQGMGQPPYSAGDSQSTGQSYGNNQQ